MKPLKNGFESNEIKEVNGNFEASKEPRAKKEIHYFVYKYSCYYFVGKEREFKFAGIHGTMKTNKKQIVTEINEKLRKENSHYGTLEESLELIMEDKEII